MSIRIVWDCDEEGCAVSIEVSVPTPFGGGLDGNAQWHPDGLIWCRYDLENHPDGQLLCTEHHRTVYAEWQRLNPDAVLMG